MVQLGQFASSKQPSALLRKSMAVPEIPPPRERDGSAIGLYCLPKPSSTIRHGELGYPTTSPWSNQAMAGVAAIVSNHIARSSETAFLLSN